MSLFKDQIAEDIKLIQKSWSYLDNHLKKPEYAFNYWILSRIYDIDEEIIPSLITEYNDKSIDCFVHYEDSKELFIIQNKYYAETEVLPRGAVSDFLVTPLVCLNENRYKKSKELQKLFNAIKDDSDYKIHLHFYISNNNRNYDSDSAIKNFNNNPPIPTKNLLRSNIYYLDNIATLYYGQSFKNQISFRYKLQTKVRGTTLRILPDQYDLPQMSEAYYMLTPVSKLYFMYKESIKKHYPLFEENIREYLGKNSINKGIINTLKDNNDRSNFFYYNNGITIICAKVTTPDRNALELHQPQIVNGCQTVNSIYEVLNDYLDNEVEKEFEQTFVMVKILLFDEKTEKIKSGKFYKDIVKFNNKQNSINENAFGARKKIFESLQTEFKERGFLLLVKPSDKNIFNNSLHSDAITNSLLEKANEYANKIGIQFSRLSELFIPLEKLLQVYLAFIKDGFHAYTKKDALLNQTSEIYKDYSLNIHKVLTHDNLIRLYLIYLKAENNRSQSDDKKTPIPYYLIGFFGRFIKNKEKVNWVLESFFSNANVSDKVFKYLEKLTNLYKNNYIESTGSEYNMMIKKQIDEQILDKQIRTLNEILLDNDLKKYFESLQ
jgi:hypothetical protein